MKIAHLPVAIAIDRIRQRVDGDGRHGREGTRRVLHGSAIDKR